MFLPNMAKSKVDPRRSIHQGGHKKLVNDKLADKMRAAQDIGRNENWTQKKYRNALEEIISDERRLLRSGERRLNKNARPGAYY